jgi:hypothetical protein
LEIVEKVKTSFGSVFHWKVNLSSLVEIDQDINRIPSDINIVTPTTETKQKTNKQAEALKVND